MSDMWEKTIREWFKDNRANHVQSDSGTEFLTWAKPDSSVYLVNYIMRGNTLHVSGDLGFASYWWSQVHDLRWVAGCNIDYFASKCEASENGRGYREFNDDQLRKQVEFALKSTDGSEAELREKFAELGGWRHIEDEFDWIAWLRDNGPELFGDCWYELGMDGYRLNPRCHAHLIGLKMAFEQLDKELTHAKGVGEA